MHTSFGAQALSEGKGIYTTFLHSKNNALQQCQTPSPAGEGWGEENKINWLYPPHPSLLPQGRRSSHFCRYLCVLKRTL